MSPPQYLSRYFILAMIIAHAAISPPSVMLNRGLFANRSLLIWWYSFSWSIDFQLSIRLSSRERQYISLNPGRNLISRIWFLPSPIFLIKGQFQNPWISSQSSIPFSSRLRYLRFFHFFGSISNCEDIFEQLFLHRWSSSMNGRAGVMTSTYAQSKNIPISTKTFKLWLITLSGVLSSQND